MVGKTLGLDWREEAKRLLEEQEQVAAKLQAKRTADLGTPADLDDMVNGVVYKHPFDFAFSNKNLNRHTRNSWGNDKAKLTIDQAAKFLLAALRESGQRIVGVGVPDLLTEPHLLTVVPDASGSVFIFPREWKGFPVAYKNTTDKRPIHPSEAQFGHLIKMGLRTDGPEIRFELPHGVTSYELREPLIKCIWYADMLPIRLALDEAFSQLSAGESHEGLQELARLMAEEIMAQDPDSGLVTVSYHRSMTGDTIQLYASAGNCDRVQVVAERVRSSCYVKAQVCASITLHNWA
jgi:hypothetical protein